jgi:hypothetical protein
MPLLNVTGTNETNLKHLFRFFRKPKPPVRRLATTDPGVIASLLEEKIPGIPSGSIVRLASDYPFNLKVVRRRSSKSGDFRSPCNGDPARITVNGDLNPYAFLITFVHELAHYVVWIDSRDRKRRPQPHGTQWKTTFREMMQPFLAPHIIPPVILFPLALYLKNPRASSSADQELLRALRTFDNKPGIIHLEDLPFDSVFSIGNGMVFKKKDKLRTRYTCICQRTNRTYRISSLAEVTPIAK